MLLAENDLLHMSTKRNWMGN